MDSSPPLSARAAELEAAAEAAPHAAAPAAAHAAVAPPKRGWIGALKAAFSAFRAKFAACFNVAFTDIRTLTPRGWRP
jgi:hypothetical protein